MIWLPGDVVDASRPDVLAFQAVDDLTEAGCRQTLLRGTCPPELAGFLLFKLGFDRKTIRGEDEGEKERTKVVIFCSGASC